MIIVGDTSPLFFARFWGTVLLLLCSVPASAEIRGNYGVLSDFACRSETEVRSDVQVMADTFGVREFQFYDWFVDYSTPTSGASWTDPFRHRRQICLSTIRYYIDEIHRHHARAWAYVQAVGAEENNLADTAAGIYRLVDAEGKWHWHERRFPTYFLNASWARRMVSVWATSVARLGFDGIHWDTLGPIAGDYGAESAGAGEFLRTAHNLLSGHGLSQTFNFIDLSWWNTELMTAGIVEFPYAEIWNRKTESRFYQIMDSPKLGGSWGVMAFYPNVDMPPNGNESRVMLNRWLTAQKHRLVYLLVCNGAQRVSGPYYPDSLLLSQDERDILAGNVPRVGDRARMRGFPLPLRPEHGH